MTERLITKIEDNFNYYGVMAEVDYNKVSDRIIIDTETLCFSFHLSQYNDDWLIDLIKYLRKD